MKDLIIVWKWRKAPNEERYYYVDNQSVHGTSTTWRQSATRLSKEEADAYRHHWLSHPDQKHSNENWTIYAERARSET